jgi:predicted ArsR family transcriptional regulator
MFPKNRHLDPSEELGVLADPIRHRLYLQVLTPGREVSRDQAAKALGISKSLAAHHLEKLVQNGLLEFEFRRLSGRTGPGAGRPAKLYRRSAKEVGISFPPRRYELAAQLLVIATREGGAAQTVALNRAAEEWGRRLGAEARAAMDSNPDPARIARAITTALRTTGFEPRHEGNEILLENCPFAAIQREVPTLTCGMNFALCRGILEGLEAQEWMARLEPRPGRCCVVFEHRPAESTSLTA